MLIEKRTTLLPINCYYGISVLAKNEAVLISIPWYMVFSVYRPTLDTGIPWYRPPCPWYNRIGWTVGFYV